MALDQSDLEAIAKAVAAAMMPKDLAIGELKMMPMPVPVPAKPGPENGYKASEFLLVCITGALSIIGIFAAAFHVSPELVDAINKATPYLVGIATAYAGLRTGLKAVHVMKQT